MNESSPAPSIRCSCSSGEFLDSYAIVAGPLNVFHLLCLALLGYAVFLNGAEDRQHALA
jgi:hypothetical protein